jgi:hypothetical protein
VLATKRELRRARADRHLAQALTSRYWELIDEEDREDVRHAWTLLYRAQDQVHPIHIDTVRWEMEQAITAWQQERMIELRARPMDRDARLFAAGVIGEKASNQCWRRRRVHGVIGGPAIWEPEVTERWYGDKNGAVPERHPLLAGVRGGMSDY